MNYIVFKERHGPFGGIIDVQTDKYYRIYHIPKKKLTKFVIAFVLENYVGRCGNLGWWWRLNLLTPKEQINVIERRLTICVEWIYILDI